MPVRSLLYYLGSRDKFKPKILPLLKQLSAGCQEYREPFAGGLSVGLAMMSRRPDLRMWVNDRDPSVACFWYCVRNFPDALIARIRPVEPSIATFRVAKALLNRTIRIPENSEDIADVALARLIVQNMSFSSLGSGPRGGNQQFYGRIGERWKPEAISREVAFHSARLRRLNVRITGYDFERLILDDSCRAILYLDPPFLMVSNQYPYRMSFEDHKRLADLLAATSHPFVMSQSDHPKTRELYAWAQVQEIG